MYSTAGHTQQQQTKHNAQKGAMYETIKA